MEAHNGMAYEQKVLKQTAVAKGPTIADRFRWTAIRFGKIQLVMILLTALWMSLTMSACADDGIQPKYIAGEVLVGVRGGTETAMRANQVFAGIGSPAGYEQALGVYRVTLRQGLGV